MQADKRECRANRNVLHGKIGNLYRIWASGRIIALDALQPSRTRVFNEHIDGRLVVSILRSIYFVRRFFCSNTKDRSNVDD